MAWRMSFHSGSPPPLLRESIQTSLAEIGEGLLEPTH